MTVNTRYGNYPIHFLKGQEATSAWPENAVVITDENVARLYPNWIKDRRTFLLPPGEEQKNLKWFGTILEWLATEKVTRSGHMIAFGGGVIGDLAGFAAASFMRGISYTQVPTTLLAQVDSAVGGKVGIDLPQGKNLAGAFHPPREVLVCVELLRTLDDRQFANGMAEVWKYAFIGETQLLPELKSIGRQSDVTQMESIVRCCLNHKRKVVECDEFETLGLRATLNFGHTVGHAIEQVTEYRRFLHGEAISIGMVVETKLGEALGITEKGTSDEVRTHLANQGLPVMDSLLKDTNPLIQSMKGDKKARNGKLAFSLLTKMGECKLVEGISERDVELALREV